MSSDPVAVAPAADHFVPVRIVTLPVVGFVAVLAVVVLTGLQRFFYCIGHLGDLGSVVTLLYSLILLPQVHRPEPVHWLYYITCQQGRVADHYQNYFLLPDSRRCDKQLQPSIQDLRMSYKPLDTAPHSVAFWPVDPY